MAFPSSIPSYTGFTSTHTLSQDQHAAQHNSEQADIVALAQKVGTGSSTPVNNTVLRGNGTGTTAYGLVRLDTDVAGVVGTSNGGTGQTSLTSLPLVSPAISGGGSWTGGPTLGGPVISDFTSATHTHNSNSGGGTLNAANALQAGTVSFANLLATIFSGQITTGVIAGTFGGTYSYLNLGGLKLLWGLSALQGIGAGGEASLGCGFPAASFATTPTLAMAVPYNLGTVPGQSCWANGLVSTQMTVSFYNPGGSTGQIQAMWLVIGT